MSDYSLPMNIGNPDEILSSILAKEVIKLTGTSQKMYTIQFQRRSQTKTPGYHEGKENPGWEPKFPGGWIKNYVCLFKTLSQDDLYQRDHKNFGCLFTMKKFLLREEPVLLDLT